MNEHHLSKGLLKGDYLDMKKIFWVLTLFMVVLRWIFHRWDTFLDYSGKLFLIIKKGFPLRLIICDITPEKIPASTIFGHPYGITIGSVTKLGERCNIRQNVTIGNRHGETKGAVIGNNVSIGAGAIILGDIKIGNNAVIGAGSVVLDDVPANSVVVGNPARVVKYKRINENEGNV